MEEGSRLSDLTWRSLALDGETCPVLGIRRESQYAPTSTLTLAGG